MSAAANFLNEAAHFAAMYRVGIVVNREGYFYPPSDRDSRRFDGVMRTSRWFLLSPVELPIVPIAAEYSIYYFDFAGLPMEAPEGKECLELEPLAIVSVESGERKLAKK